MAQKSQLELQKVNVLWEPSIEVDFDAGNAYWDDYSQREKIITSIFLWFLATAPLSISLFLLGNKIVH